MNIPPRSSLAKPPSLPTRKDGTSIRKGDAEWRPEVTKAEREHMPAALAAWLVDLARRCSRVQQRRAA